MRLFTSEDRVAAEAIAGLVDCNPFLPERIALERQALGAAFVPLDRVWHAEGESTGSNPNTPRLRQRAETLVADLHRNLASGARATADELTVCHGLVHYLLWLRYEDDLYYLAFPDDHPKQAAPTAARVFAAFHHDLTELLGALPLEPDRPHVDSAHLFAIAFQARRAFHHIFRRIFGASLPIARLRATVWQSVFTRTPTRYRTAYFDRMRDIPTLVTGASGTGKELVARAIAFSQYIPFDPKTHAFAVDAHSTFHAINISAFSPSVVESELFGHRRGAFTGADSDRVGWFERCGRHGTVFVDELGELDPNIQVKLLRVLQNRELQRIGDTETRRFAGKVVAATNRDLVREIRRGRFREDLYYRICADTIALPSLCEQLSDCPDDLHNLVMIAARHLAGDDGAAAVAAEVEAWIDAHLGRAYTWPGNMRELEQCVRSVVVHGTYQPQGLADAADGLAAEIREAALTADQLLARYIEVTYANTASLREVSRLLDLDRRAIRRLMGWKGNDEGGNALA